MAIPKRSKKSKAVRTPKFVDEKYTGPEPDWDNAEKWSAEKYYRERARVGFYYNYFFTSKEGKPWILDWMKRNEYKKEEISAVKSLPDSAFSIAYAGLCKALLRGMPPYHSGLNEYISTLRGVGENSMRNAVDVVKEKVANYIEQGKLVRTEKKEVEKAKAKVYRPSIQELLREKASEMTEEIEVFIDSFDYKKSSLKSFDPLSMLRKVEAKGMHAKKIRGFYQREYDELFEVLNPPKRMTDAKKDDYDQLKEGYSHLKKSEIQALVDMYRSILDACDMIEQEGKVNRAPRKKKPVSKEKLVAKVKYCISDESTKSVSVKPVDLLGAVAALVYNTKTRKLGIYVAQDEAGFSFKGTTLLNFDESKSVQKTLRKPAEQLSPFKRIAKRSLQKEFENIKSVEIKLNGRFNEQTLILKVF
jgi:hypothetical protein